MKKLLAITSLVIPSIPTLILVSCKSEKNEIKLDYDTSIKNLEKKYIYLLEKDERWVELLKRSDTLIAEKQEDRKEFLKKWEDLFLEIRELREAVRIRGS